MNHLPSVVPIATNSAMAVAEFRLPSCDADATLPPAYRTAARAGMEETGPRDQLQVTKRIN